MHHRRELLSLRGPRTVRSSGDHLWDLGFSVVSWVSLEKKGCPVGRTSCFPGTWRSLYPGRAWCNSQTQVHPERRRGGESGVSSPLAGPDAAKGDDARPWHCPRTTGLSGRRRRSPGKTDFPRGTPVSTWARHTLSTELCTPLPTAPSHQRLNSCWPNAEMEHNSTVLPPTSMSSACLLSVEHFSQRICLIREIRARRNKGKTVKGDQIMLM